MNRNLWYGFLDAGEKSSPVVIDLALTHDTSDTVYVFNHTRNKILEYKRHILDKKLRELSLEEAELINTLTAGYEQAREQFLPKHIKAPALSYSDHPPAQASSKAQADDEVIHDEDGFPNFGDFGEEDE